MSDDAPATKKIDLETYLENLGQPGHIEHPSAIREVDVHEPLKGWRYADNEAVDADLGHALVRCKIIEIHHLDQFGMPMQIIPAIKAQFFDTVKRKWDGDESVRQISADIMLDEYEDGKIKRPGLKTQFGSTIKLYAEYLVKEGRDIPLSFLGDLVYGEILFALELNGIRSVQAFAAADDDALDMIRARMREEKQGNYAGHITQMQDRARKKLEVWGYVAPVPSPDATSKKTREKVAA